MRAPAQRRGSTLTEVLIYCCLLMVNLTLAYAMWLAGHRYMLTTRAQVQVQQAGNTTTYHINTELMEAPAASLEVFPRGVAPDSTVVGVTFFSARTFAEPESFVTDTARGFPVWQKVVGYYLDADPGQPTNTAIRALYRVDMVPSGYTPTGVITRPSALGITTQTLRGLPEGPTVRRRLVAQGLAAPTAADPHGGFDLFFQKVGGVAPDWNPAAPEYAQVSNPLFLVLRPLNNTSGRQSKADGALRNEVRLDSTVKMRN